MPPAQFKQVEKLAKKENRTLSELIREALRRYQQEEDDRMDQRAKLRFVLEETRAAVERKGTHKLTMKDIDAEIAAYRRGRRQATR